MPMSSGIKNFIMTKINNVLSDFSRAASAWKHQLCSRGALWEGSSRNLPKDARSSSFRAQRCIDIAVLCACFFVRSELLMKSMCRDRSLDGRANTVPDFCRLHLETESRYTMEGISLSLNFTFTKRNKT
ncbi:hypothetical protein KSP39_PZI005936 [Platanthera zijinensis]|uniref:Uncharacterized protein n=1 Tax=Platanthera zijinensis TaxID=2320716 RepID=A0AAP0BUM4_9ASPA